MTIKNVLKCENTAHITKMSIESTVATASLAAAITTLLIATKVIAGPASLALIASPAGIAVLFITAVYFAAAAYASYQQMHKNEEISEAKAGAETAANKAEAAKASAEEAKTEVEEKIKDLATKDELNNKADKSELNSKFNADALEGELKKLLPSILVDPNVVTADVKKAFAIAS